MNDRPLTAKQAAIVAALVKANGNASEAARELGLSGSTVRGYRRNPTVKKALAEAAQEIERRAVDDVVLSRDWVKEKTLELYDAAIKKKSLVAAGQALAIGERLTRDELPGDPDKMQFADLVREGAQAFDEAGLTLDDIRKRRH